MAKEAPPWQVVKMRLVVEMEHADGSVSHSTSTAPIPTSCLLCRHGQIVSPDGATTLGTLVVKDGTIGLACTGCVPV